jgi:hypothetical protein
VHEHGLTGFGRRLFDQRAPGGHIRDAERRALPNRVIAGLSRIRHEHDDLRPTRHRDDTTGRPTGGGARNTYGAFYGSQLLPATPGDVSAFDGGQISDTIRLGGDLRFNIARTEQDEADTQQGFNTHSGQMYVTVAPVGSRFLLHVDQQVAPGGTRNREAFILARLTDHHYLKAGNILLPYGLRLQDDSAFIREASQVTFDNSEQGVELGLTYGTTLLNFAVTNGTSGQTNNDDRFQYIARGEYLGDGWRLGAGYIFNDAEVGERHLANVFGGFSLGDYAFLFELGRLEDESVLNVDGRAEVRYVGFAEVNWNFAQGYNLKLTTEYLDPDRNIDNIDRARHSLLLEYTPYAHMQVLGGVRVGDDIPQRPQGNFTRVFAQLHFYY